MAVSELAGLAPNTPYHYRISATNAAGTAKGADRSVKTLPIVEPTVNTEPATAVEPTSAVLNGTVNPNGSEVTECLFEYGTTPSYGTIASCYENPGSGNSPVTVKPGQIKVSVKPRMAHAGYRPRSGRHRETAQGSPLSRFHACECERRRSAHPRLRRSPKAPPAQATTTAETKLGCAGRSPCADDAPRRRFNRGR